MSSSVPVTQRLLARRIDQFVFGRLGPRAVVELGRDGRQAVGQVGQGDQAQLSQRGIDDDLSGERAVLDVVLRTAQSSIIDLTQRGAGLGSLKAVIRRTALVITNDTGPRHIAAALGTPIVSLFGPTDHRWTSQKLPNEQIILAEPFLPEELIADHHPKLCAIDRITVEDVLAAARGQLDETSGRAS